MKSKSTIVLVFITLVVNIHSIAQNWAIINPTYKYNYSTTDYKFENIKTIYVDSLSINGSDTVFYLNRVFVSINKGSRNNIDTIVINRSQFLQRKIEKKANGDTYLIDTIAFLMKTHANVGDSWMFDSINSISAQLISIEPAAIFNLNDSIKKIVLSSSDTIVLSKNYGLLEYSVSYLDTNKYFLIGVEGLNLGLQTPKYKDIFNFNVGDIFDYHKYHAYETWSVYSSYYSQWDIRYTILSKNIIGGTLFYEVNILQKAVLDGGFGNPDITSYTETNTTLKFIDDANNILNGYNQELRIESSIYKELSFVTDTTFDMVGKSIVRANAVHNLNGDTNVLFINWDGLCTVQKAFYLKERGLMKYHYEDREYPRNNIVDSTLVGCKINGVIYGEFKPDSLFRGPSPIQNSDFSIYPNPAGNEFTIETGPLLKECILSILNINGQEVFQLQLTKSKTQIDISVLSNGIYFIKLTTDKISELRMIIKE